MQPCCSWSIFTVTTAHFIYYAKWEDTSETLIPHSASSTTPTPEFKKLHDAPSAAAVISHIWEKRQGHLAFFSLRASILEQIALKILTSLVLTTACCFNAQSPGADASPFLLGKWRLYQSKARGSPRECAFGGDCWCGLVAQSTLHLDVQERCQGYAAVPFILTTITSFPVTRKWSTITSTSRSVASGCCIWKHGAKVKDWQGYCVKLWHFSSHWEFNGRCFSVALRKFWNHSFFVMKIGILFLPVNCINVLVT